MSVASNSKALIRQSCDSLFAPGQVAELRILGIGGRDRHSASGWFADMDALATAADHYGGKNPQGIYVTLNPLHKACLARSSNRLREYLRVASSDRDIIRRHWLPIDIDPARPSGISSSNDELQASLATMKHILAYLSDLGFSSRGALTASSGNGVHLLYRIDLPNDDDSKSLVTKCLRALDDRFSDDDSKIDISNCNAARIWKLYGTVARKGEHTADRPHRRSKLWTPRSFGEFEIVPAEALLRLAEDAASKPAKGKASRSRSRSKSAGHVFDLDAFIADHNIPVKRDEAWDGTGRRYILEHCLFDPSHTGTSAALGRAPNGNIFYQCQHDSCANNGWAEVRALYEDKGAKRSRRSETIEREESKAGQKGGEPKRKGGRSPQKLNTDSPWDLARQIIEDEYCDPDSGMVLIRRYQEQFYIYNQNKHCYVEVPDDEMRVRTTRWLGEHLDKFGTRKRNDVLDSIGSTVAVPPSIAPPFTSKIDLDSAGSTSDPRRYHRIALQNGILDLDAVLRGDPVSEALTGHTPEWFCTVALPFDFPIRDEQTQCPVWQQFLMEVFEGDESRVALIQEACGYCFMPHTRLERFFVLQGLGSNGKTTILQVIRQLLGEANVSSLSLEQLCDEKMVLGIRGKLANLDDDMNAVDRVAEGVLKRLVSGQPIVADRKYKSQVEFAPTAKLFLATNPLPRFTDTTRGIWRRMILIPFRYSVPIDKIDINLSQKLTAELSGIFYWAIQGFLRLNSNGRFSRSRVCEQAVLEYRRGCFPILTFLDERTEMSGCVTANRLWNEYRKWCGDVGLSKPKPLHPFMVDIENFRPSVKVDRPKSTDFDWRVTIDGLSIRAGGPDDEADLLGLPSGSY